MPWQYEHVWWRYSGWPTRSNAIRAAGRASGCFKLALRAISTLSRVYLSDGGGEFSNWSECWVLSVIMVLSSWSFNCSWFLGLAEGHLGMSLKCGSFQTNVMSIDRRAVFKEHVYVVGTQRTASSHYLQAGLTTRLYCKVVCSIHYNPIWHYHWKWWSTGLGPACMNVNAKSKQMYIMCLNNKIFSCNNNKI